MFRSMKFSTSSNRVMTRSLMSARCLTIMPPSSRCTSTIPMFCGSTERPLHHQFHTISSNNRIHTALPSYSILNRSTVLISIRQRSMIPRKAALKLTPNARELFQKIIAATDSEGIMLKYEISSQHALRMAFKFDLIKDAKKELDAQDEG